MRESLSSVAIRASQARKKEDSKKKKTGHKTSIGKDPTKKLGTLVFGKIVEVKSAFLDEVGARPSALGYKKGLGGFITNRHSAWGVCWHCRAERNWAELYLPAPRRQSLVTLVLEGTRGN